MKKKFLFLLVILGILTQLSVCAKSKITKIPNNYVILINSSLMRDVSWANVAMTLSESHGGAEAFVFDKHPSERLDTLKVLQPRYLAIIDVPSNIDRKYVAELNQLVRKFDDDIYQDALWGIITGYSAQTAMRMVQDASSPFKINTLVSTISELKSGVWFSRMLDIEDQDKGKVWYKDNNTLYTKTLDMTTVKFGRFNVSKAMLETFHNAMQEINPDLVVTAAHATENNLEMPYSAGNIKCRAGLLYTDFPDGAQALFPSSLPHNRRVYLPVGNCLIGNMNGTAESMASAWLCSGKASCMIGYIIPTWYGRAGWGGLKYFLFNPGRLSCFESYFLNSQEMIDRTHKELPLLDDKFVPELELEGTMDRVQLIKDNYPEITKDQYGFYHDRDVLAYYGDPAWQIDLSPIKEYNDYTVDYIYTDKGLTIRVTTSKDFKPNNYKGNSWKSVHVGDLPMAFFFPERVASPVLDGKKNPKSDDYILEENSLLVYNPDLQPGQVYEWKIVTKK